jgi:hypothetical protein
MVAKITVPKTVRRALNYNEQKVKEGAAECISAHGFLKEAEALNFYDKLHRFESLISLNKRAKTNAVHVSLNFTVADELTKEKLVEIASVYMKGIGFGEQPYLVYQHLDAGHPHVHIVTTNIQRDGRRISLHNLGKNASNEARREIEKQYGLVKAENQQKQISNEIKPLDASRVVYGKSPIKRAITNVLDAVLPTYRYASLAELNAVLKLYNVVADTGKPDGMIAKNAGLVYRALDEEGTKIGVPIKASSIYSKPTLTYLQEKFRQNEPLKASAQKSIKTTIDWVLHKPPTGLQAFKEALQKERISLVVRQNEQGIIYGLTYVDHNAKSVFNGSDLGKDYTAKAVLQKCGVGGVLPGVEKREIKPPIRSQQSMIPVLKQAIEHGQQRPLFDILLRPDETPNAVPYELKKGKKRKRKQ